MPEIKNNFLAGKMNKDLDDRLIPQGEYINALNVQITKSDGSNVGVIHNIKGNAQVSEFSPLGEDPAVIGSFFDDKNNRAFWFVTDGGNNNYIYMYDFTGSGTPYTLASGAFLNFSKSNKITGINLLEDFLFWTDNLNQPRRINVSRAIDAPSYYSSEAKVSVAKYAPHLAPTVQAGYDPDVESKLMEEEFVRFAYRYKFIDNEYSIISPFSQIAFELGDGATSDNSISVEDEERIFESTENFKVINRANKATLGINLPSTNPVSDYGIVSIDVLYKESDSVAVRIVDTIRLVDSGISSQTYEYVYKSTPSKSTLPEDQITRAFDNVPIKALAQEVAGNRVVYGNFTENYDLPVVDYDVYCTEKSGSDYPHHSVKQRRDYEVGIVLADKYGRTSPVILSDTSRITVSAKPEEFDSLNWIGDSIKVVFNQNITGDSLHENMSGDLGWYTYRVVVKQTQQEYYNVYNPGITRGYITIHNDNINKVPRNTDDSIDSDDLYPTKSRLYPKVINYDLGSGQAIYQKLSNEGLYNIESIGTADAHDVFDVGTTTSYGFYQQSKMHLLGKLEEGITGNNVNTPFSGTLSVFETEPFRSTLDIYYETSTSGIIQELNQAADAQIQTILIEPSNFGTGTEGSITVSEATPSGNYVARIRAIDSSSGLDMPYVTFTLNESTSQFEIERDTNDGYYKIKTRQDFIYSTTPANNLYGIDVTGVNFTTINKSITIANAAPTISGLSYVVVNNTLTTGQEVFRLSITTGSADENASTAGLSVSHTETYDHGSQTNIFNSAISGNEIIFTVASSLNSHHGESIIVNVTLTDGSFNVEKQLTAYVSVESGGLQAVTLKYEPYINYGNTANACVNVNLFSFTPEIYTDVPDSGSILFNAPQIYGTPTGSKLAASGWYADPLGGWTGKWTVLQTSSGSVGYWEVAPAACTT